MKGYEQNYLDPDYEHIAKNSYLYKFTPNELRKAIDKLYYRLKAVQREMDGHKALLGTIESVQGNDPKLQKYCQTFLQLSD